MEKGKAREVRVSAKSLEKALAEAASQLKTDSIQLDYKIVSQKSGFLFFGKSVEIIARVKSVGRRAEARFNDEAPRESEPLTDAELNGLKAELKEFCEGIASFFAEGPVTVSASLVDDRLILDIDDEGLEAQIMRNQKLAESLEHVLRKKPRHLKRELPFRIFVDARSVRQRREQDLTQMARDLSDKVFENKRPVVLNYKSSYDRKIIHMALDKDARVYTKSIGSGPNRKLMILPSKDQGAEIPEADV